MALALALALVALFNALFNVFVCNESGGGMVDDTVAGVADSALIPPVSAPAVALMPAFAPVADVFTTCFVVFPNKFPNVDPNKESSGVNIFVIYWVPFAKYMNILNPRNANMKIITNQVIQEILLKLKI